MGDDRRSKALFGLSWWDREEEDRNGANWKVRMEKRGDGRLIPREDEQKAEIKK